MEKLRIAMTLTERGPWCSNRALPRISVYYRGGYKGVSIGIKHFFWLFREHGLRKICPFKCTNAFFETKTKVWVRYS